MKITVKKLDGSQEPLDLNKILRWGSWAASESPSISLESVLTFSATAFYDGISTSEITLSICKACEDLSKSAADEGDFKLAEEYMNLARNLYIPSLLKKANYFQAAHLTPEDYLNTVFETKPCTKDIVPLQRFKIKSIIRLGIKLKTYDPLLLDGTLHEELFDKADQILDYTRMHLHPYGGLRQVEAKYLRRIDDLLLEDPEQLYILMAIAATHSDAKVYENGHTLEFQQESLENYYRIFSTGETNLPTPFLLSLRTDFKQYDSCCLLSIDDTNLSIKAGTGTAMDATVAGAGVGVSMGRIRSKGTRFRKMGKHQGALGYLGQLTKTVKASNQECYSEDHLVLTSKGFIPLKEVTESTLVAQVDEYNTTTFVQPTKIFEYDYSGPMYSFKEDIVGGIDLLVTPNHEMIYRKNDKVKFKTKPAENFKPSEKNGFVTTTMLSRKEISLTRMSTILSVLALEYCGYDDNGTLVFTSLSPEAATLMSDSITSSTIVFNGDDSLLCTNYPADLVVSFETLLTKAQPHHLIEAVDIAKKIRSQAPEQDTLPYQDKIDLLPTLIDLQDQGYVSGKNVKKTVIPYNGKVYCVEVPTHRLIVKRPDSTQVVCGNSRGGGATVNFPLWTRDIFDLIMLKDVTGVEGENRYRHLDYAFHFSKYLVNKLEMNEKILLVSPNTLVTPGVTVYDAFYHVDGQGNYDGSLFEKFCEEQLKNPDLPYLTNTNSSTISAGAPAYTTAYDLFSALVEQMMNTGRIYTLNMDNVNNHSAYLDAIEMSNLCMEILQPTYPVSLSYNSKDNVYTPDPQSEVSFCQLAGIVVGQHVTLEDIPRITYWTLRLQEAIFNISDYSQISFSDKQKKRRNVGIGLVNLQHLLVREVYSKYPQKEWVKEVGRVTHEWYESIQYHLILASTQLAEMLGPCEMIDRSRYGHGILPIDHAVKTPLTDFPLKQDWEGTLRPRLIKYKTRFSVHSALMPAESSSVVFGTINGIEFPRQPATFKGNKKLSVLVLVPEIAKYGQHYVYAWGDYSVDVNDIYLSASANITKFLDQSISYNTYVDYNKFTNNKVDELWAINTLIVKPSNAGIKTTYYINFNVDIKDKLEINTSEEISEEEKQFYDNLRQLEQDNGSGCSSGSCSL